MVAVICSVWLLTAGACCRSVTAGSAGIELSQCPAMLGGVCAIAAGCTVDACGTAVLSVASAIAVKLLGGSVQDILVGSGCC
jgi:phage I-like protein